MGKAKMTGDVAVMEVPPSSGGVRTRAKTLALQRRIQSSSTAPSPPLNLDLCYLELRSRRLERLKPPPHQQHISRKARNSHGCTDKEDRGAVDIEESSRLGLISESIEADLVSGDLELGRSTRESTPCNLIMSADTISSPRCTRKHRFTTSTAANQSTQNAPGVNVANVPEVEELFLREQQTLHRVFLEKYNFDINNDLPLPGRYEWVKIGP